MSRALMRRPGTGGTDVSRWKRHWCVDPNTGTSTCGVFPAVPAKDVLDVDCGRCMRDPDYEMAVRCERQQQADREYVPSRETAVIDLAARRRAGVTVL